MPTKVVANFTVEYVQVLDEQGNADASLMPNLPEPKIKECYHMMKLLRVFDEKLFHLQRSGKIGTYASVKGQEASEIGSAMTLTDEDWMVPSFREMGVYMVRGADRAMLVDAWRGDTRAFHANDHDRNLPVSIPIASQLLHAVGLAWAAKLRGEKSVAITYFGDGATSEGDFHEALNFAADYNVPVIFFCQNNQWAISTPREQQTHSQTIAQKGIGYGLRCIQVDGNDVLGVYKVTMDAIERARNGQGPTLIESLTFRMGDHTTSDDASRYRSEELVKQWESKDPLRRLELYFQKIGTWTDDYKKWVEETVTKEVEEAVTKGLAVPQPAPEKMFDVIFAQIIPDLKAQRDQLVAELKERESQ